MEKTYLGDSVYACCECGMIKLTTENIGDQPSNTIFLEPAVFQALVDYVARVVDETEAALAEQKQQPPK